jgi:hypothetical protein
MWGDQRSVFKQGHIIPSLSGDKPSRCSTSPCRMRVRSTNVLILPHIIDLLDPYPPLGYNQNELPV